MDLSYPDWLRTFSWLQFMVDPQCEPGEMWNEHPDQPPFNRFQLFLPILTSNLILLFNSPNMHLTQNVNTVSHPCDFIPKSDKGYSLLPSKRGFYSSRVSPFRGCIFVNFKAQTLQCCTIDFQKFYFVMQFCVAFCVVIYGEGTPNAAHSIYAICLSQHVAYFHSWNISFSFGTEIWIFWEMCRN